MCEDLPAPGFTITPLCLPRNSAADRSEELNGIQVDAGAAVNDQDEVNAIVTPLEAKPKWILDSSADEGRGSAPRHGPPQMAQGATAATSSTVPDNQEGRRRARSTHAQAIDGEPTQNISNSVPSPAVDSLPPPPSREGEHAPGSSNRAFEGIQTSVEDVSGMESRGTKSKKCP